MPPPPPPPPTNATNPHIHKYKIKSATLQKLPMENIHNKLNIFCIFI